MQLFFTDLDKSSDLDSDYYVPIDIECNDNVYSSIEATNAVDFISKMLNNISQFASKFNLSIDNFHQYDIRLIIDSLTSLKNEGFTLGTHLEEMLKLAFLTMKYESPFDNENQQNIINNEFDVEATKRKGPQLKSLLTEDIFKFHQNIKTIINLYKTLLILRNPHIQIEIQVYFNIDIHKQKIIFGIPFLDQLTWKQKYLFNPHMISTKINI